MASAVAVPEDVVEHIISAFEPSTFYRRAFSRVLRELECYSHFGWFVGSRSKVDYRCCVCDGAVRGFVTSHTHAPGVIRYGVSTSLECGHHMTYSVCSDDEGPFIACDLCAPPGVVLHDLRDVWCDTLLDERYP